MLLSIILIAIAFGVVWLSAEMAVVAVEKIALRSRFSRWTLSLFALGAVAALPEMAISANALWLSSPQVAAGGLIGSQVFLLFFVLPLLALISRGIKLETPLKNMSLSLTLLLALVPMLALLNQSLDLREALILAAVYVVFVVSFVRQGSGIELLTKKIKRHAPSEPWMELGKLVAAVLILLIAGNTLVRQIIELAAYLEMPRFLLGFLLLPIGTNLPEISLAIQSIRAGNREMAVGDFLGSITFNSFLLVVVTLLATTPIIVGLTIAPLVWLFTIGITVFGIFCYSRKTLSVVEALVLWFFYLAMVSVAWWLGFGRLGG